LRHSGGAIHQLTLIQVTRVIRAHGYAFARQNGSAVQIVTYLADEGNNHGTYEVLICGKGINPIRTDRRRQATGLKCRAVRLRDQGRIPDPKTLIIRACYVCECDPPNRSGTTSGGTAACGSALGSAHETLNRIHSNPGTENVHEGISAGPIENGTVLNQERGNLDLVADSDSTNGILLCPNAYCRGTGDIHRNTDIAREIVVQVESIIQRSCR